MIANKVAENVLGTIGAIMWSVQLIPQVVKSYRMKNTAGLSSWMLAIWFFGGIWLGAYVVVQNINIPLIVQPQCFTLLAGICWAQCLYYDQGRSKKFSIIAAIVACSLAGGVETALILGSKALEAKGNDKLTQAAGILSAIFIAGGLVPQYYEIYKFRAVIGISLIFLVVDLLGGIFSLLSLVFAEGKFDIIASLSYGIVVALEAGVFILAAILNPAHRRREAFRKNADDDALRGVSCSPSRRSDASSTATLPPLPPMVQKSATSTPTRGRSPVRRTALGWLDDAVTPQTGEASHTGLQRPDSVERELSNERYRLERMSARYA